MADEPKLKPCPWCRCRVAESREIIDDGYVYIAVECEQCGAQGPARKTAAEAIVAWNARPDGWVRVEDGLPTEEKKYLVHCPSADPDKPLIATAWYHPEEREWSLIPEYWAKGIRHWQAIPDPPETTSA